MKHFLFLCALVFCSFSVVAQSESTPLSVSQAIAQQNSGATAVWVRGYVVGEMHNYSNSKYFYAVAPPFQGTATFLLADTPYEHDFKRCLVVQFPGSALVDNFNLEENPEYWQKEMAFCGNLQSYMSASGLKSISDYRLYSGETLEDETLLWNFYEDAEDGSYIASSSSSIFAGGTYAGVDATWSIVGGTYGNSSTDNKWESASFRLRYTEGASGEKGAMFMTTDKQNGVGYVRFWAGNYKDDSALNSALAIYYSLDGGRQWIAIDENMSVKRGSTNTNNGMAEYSYRINVDGNVRLKFVKADNTSAGINIDNIHISDYKAPTSIDRVEDKTTWYQTIKGGICFLPTTHSYEAIVYQITGAVMHRVAVSDAEQTVTMPRGIYVVKSTFGAEKVVVY